MSENRKIKLIYGLTPMQQGMLLHSIMNKDSLAYSEQLSFSLAGELDITTLEKALNEIIQRHDILKSVFIYEKLDTPKQVVLTKRKATIYYTDISHLEEKERKLYILGFEEKDRGKGFYLSKGMSLRMSVLKTGVNEYKIFFTFHHIIMDGWCLGIVLKDLFEAHFALMKQGSIQWEPVPPFFDYIKWLGNKDMQQSALFWEDNLAGYEKKDFLIKSNKRKRSGWYTRKTHNFVIEREDTHQLKQIAQQNNVTLNTIMQTIWGVLVQKYTNSNDVVFGTVFSGRPAEIADIEKMVGLFINTIPSRVQCKADVPFCDLLKQVQHSYLKAEKHGYCSLAEIQARNGYKQGLFDHILAFENYPLDQEIKSFLFGNSSYGFRISDLKVFEQTIYDFNIVFLPGQELGVQFIFNLNSFEIATIHRLETHLKVMVKQIIENPQILIKDIDITDSEEKYILIKKFNRNRHNLYCQKTVHELFEEQVANNPFNIAVVCGDEEITYQQLNFRANRLARYLREKGVKPDSIVGILAERSVEIITAMLGVLKAGGAYLPLDPNYPEERIDFMLKDSEVKVLLVQKKLKINFSADAELITINDDTYSDYDYHNPDTVSCQDNLIYLIYTSGSTGKPKGVMVKHKGIVNMIYQHWVLFEEAEGVRVSQVSSPSFDAMVLEVWPSLTGGASLYIVDDETRLDPLKLKEWLIENRIEVSFQSTAIAMTLLDFDWKEKDIALRCLRTGGDRLIKYPRKEYPFKIYNLYGPTEDSVWTTWKEVIPDSEATSAPTIGQPAINHSVYIVDSYLQLKPIGVPGELCISGLGLARGYLNRPGLTASRFVDNPYEPGEKLYRTGDLARFLPDGDIEFLGRIDQQVKIRGNRVELGEIESRLVQHKHIKKAVVIDRNDAEGHKYLGAYIIADQEISIRELKEHIGATLPEYMIPAYFVQMDSFPLTPNGKIDRKTLSHPVEQVSTGVEYISPVNERQKEIVEIWQDVLGIEKIGINDNFFDIGGNSLKAIQVHARMMKKYDLSLTDLFEYETVASLSTHIHNKKEEFRMQIEQIKKKSRQRKTGDIIFTSMDKINSYHCNNRRYMNIDLEARNGYKNVLLTGATGFLGIHLLYELLSNTDYSIYLLIRGITKEDAQKKLFRKIKFYFNEELYWENVDRINLVYGSIEKENFGMHDADYFFLSDNIDCIINSASNVKHYGNYKDFYNPNIKGVEQVIKFAEWNKKKDVHHISTLSVGLCGMQKKEFFIFTESDYNLSPEHENYYIQTKAEAENLLIDARSRGIRTNIFRVGNLVFNSQSGRFQQNITDNAFYSNIKSYIKLGLIPEIKHRTIDFSFIDYISRAIILLLDRNALCNEIYHISNPNSVSLFEIGKYIEKTGYSLKSIAFDKFLDFLYDNHENIEVKQYIMNILVHSHFLDNTNLSGFMHLNEKTNLLLEKLGLNWIKLDEGLMGKMLNHCKEVDFI